MLNKEYEYMENSDITTIQDDSSIFSAISSGKILFEYHVNILIKSTHPLELAYAETIFT